MYYNIDDQTGCCLEVRVYDNYPEQGGKLKHVVTHAEVVKKSRAAGLKLAEGVFATRKSDLLEHDCV
ncbi:MAG: hypothetical protein H8D23_37295 [Candidatus Brocadiales bacterium]|nr:hypothetical protein [Candidatus Brocadiales bacterium]